MYKIENTQIYKHEKGEGYEIWSPSGPEYRVTTAAGVKAWERFDIETGAYVPAPEYTEPFPEDPIMPIDPEQRITQLETESLTVMEVAAMLYEENLLLKDQVTQAQADNLTAMEAIAMVYEMLIPA